MHRSPGWNAAGSAGSSIIRRGESPLNQLPVLKIGKHQPLYPMIQGGMGVAISGPNLAGHVARCGGVGTIASVGLACNSPHYNGRNYFEANQLAVKEGIQEARKIAGPEGVIAVNCMVALTDYDRHVKSACEGGVDVIISGAGLPLRLPEYAKEYPDVALVPIVSTVKAASLISRRWEKTYGRLPDGFVVETPKYAGGHLGVTKMDQVEDDEFSLEKVVPELVEFVEKEMGKDVPVIAAGGIWDRKDMERAFGLGAKGVQMGTRFACTFEGDASERFKQAYIDAREEDVVIIQSPAGLPGRALRSPFIDQYLKGHVESKPCIANCLTHCRYKTERETFCIAQALIDAYRGNWEEGLFFCGSNVTKVEKMEHVEDIMKELFPA
jgi:nitronate monooxygenase